MKSFTVVINHNQYYSCVLENAPLLLTPVSGVCRPSVPADGVKGKTWGPSSAHQLNRRPPRPRPPLVEPGGHDTAETAHRTERNGQSRSVSSDLTSPDLCLANLSRPHPT